MPDDDAGGNSDQGSNDDSGGSQPVDTSVFGDDDSDSGAPQPVDTSVFGDDDSDSGAPQPVDTSVFGDDPSTADQLDSDAGQAAAGGNTGLAGAEVAGAGALGVVGGSNLPNAGSAGGAIASGASGGAQGLGMVASVVSAVIQCIDEPLPPIVFSYNPDKYTQKFEGKWKTSLQPASMGPPPQWLGMEPQHVSVNLVLDQFAVPPPDMPIQAVVDELKRLVQPTPESLAAGSAIAPMVMFMWGDNIILDQAYVVKVSVTYERFLAGNPVRASVDVEMQGVPLPSPLGATNPTSGGLARRKTRTMVQGDSLPSIAFQEYKDPNKWRALAEANRIDDPMRIKMGTVIAVPDRREAENLS